MIEFCCPKCQATLKVPAEKAGAATKCPKCRCPVRVPVHLAVSPPRPLIHLPQRRRPSSKAGGLVLVALGLFAAMLAGGVAVFAAIDLGGWLEEDPGHEEKLAAAGQTPHPAATPPAKPSDTALAVKPSNGAPPAKQSEPAPQVSQAEPAPKAPEPAAKAPNPAQPVKQPDAGSAKAPAPAPQAKPPDAKPPDAKPPDAKPPVAKPPVPANPNALRGDAQMVDDLKVTTLKLPVAGLLPCMLWADAEGSAFLTLHSDTGTLRRVSYPGLEVTKQKNLDGKFSWMSMSAEGVLLSSPDSEKIWVVDPATLEVKTKIDVPKLRRAVSAPRLTWAVACDQSLYQRQKLYMVDLVKKNAVACAVPQGIFPGFSGGAFLEKDPVQTPIIRWVPGYGYMVIPEPSGLTFPDGTHGRARPAQGNVVGVDSPAVTPDGAYVYTQGYNLVQTRSGPAGGADVFVAPAGDASRPKGMVGIPTMFRFSVKNGKLTYQDCDPARTAGDGSGMGEIAISPDSKLVCLPGQPSKGYATPIYPRGTFQKHVCTLDADNCTRAVGFDLKAGYTYTQNAGHELIVFSPHGIKKKQYALERPIQVVGPVCTRWGVVIRPGYSRPWQEGDPAGVVQQYLVHPAGNQLVLLTGAAVYALEVPKIE